MPIPRSAGIALEPPGRDRYGGEMRGRIVPLAPVLLLGLAAALSPARAATPFVPLSEATAARVCPHCEGRPMMPEGAARPARSTEAPPPSYTPLAPARWVGTPHRPGPFPPKPPALS